MSGAPPDPNDLAAQALTRLGAQRDLPLLPLTTGWHFGDWSLNQPGLVLLAVLILCAAVLAFTGLRLRRGGADPWDTRVAEADGATAHAQANLQRAETLAAAGLYMEAMHELLLQCVADVRAARTFRLDESLTSREILHRATLPPEGADALADIISSVEWTYFGRRPADALHWQECRARFDQVRGALAAHA
jgi:hypothetical protein